MSDWSGIHYVVNVEAAVYRDGEYLLGRRADTEDHAAGEWALIGGKVEGIEEGDAVLEATVEREVREEAGVEVGETEYVHSAAFVGDGGSRVVNVVFLCEYDRGEPRAREPEEVDRVEWRPAEGVLDDGAVPPYTREYLRAVDRRRRELGW